MNILYKSILCMIVLLLFVMALLFTLSFFKFQTVLSYLIANRLSATAPTIYESIEGAIDFGLGLGEIQNTERVILWVQKNNPGIQSIDIFNIKGRILYSTEKQSVGKNIASQILENLRTSPEHSFQIESDDSFLSGFRISNNYDQRVGGGLITYSKNEYNSQVVNFRNSLILKVGIITITFAIIVSIGIMIAFRGLRKYLKSIEDSHDKIRSSKAMGQNVCFIDLSGLPAVASNNSLFIMDGFDDRLCKIERNIADAFNAIDSLELLRPEESGDENRSVKTIFSDQQSALASIIARPLIVLMMAAIFLSSIIFAYISFIEFSRYLEPELKKKAQLIALNLERDLKQAVGFGIPFHELVGVNEYLDAITDEFDEITFLKILNPMGKPIYLSGQSKISDSNLDPSNQLSDIKGQKKDCRLPIKVYHL